MAVVYRRYCQAAAVVFLLITGYTVLTKLAQGGWPTTGSITPFAIPLGVADDVFHVILSLPALAIVILHGTGWTRHPPPAKGRRTTA